MKLCKDCAHAKFHVFGWEWKCYNPKWAHTDPVTGRVYVYSCEYVRNRECGKDFPNGFKPRGQVEQVAQRLLGKEYDVNGS